MAHKKEIVYPYRDLTGEQHGTYLIKAKKSPKEPGSLNEASFLASCTECGAERQIGGRLLQESTFKACICQKKPRKLAKGEVEVGLGLHHLMSTDKTAFSEYIKRKEEENRRGNSTPYSRVLNEESKNSK